MNAVIDILIGIIVLVFLVSGIKKGLIRQVLEVIGIIAAFIGAFYLAHRLAAYLEPRIGGSYQISLVVAALVIFIGVIIGFHFAGVAIRKILKMTVLGSFDSVMGGVLGAVKGVLISSLLLILLFALPLPGGMKNEMRKDPLIANVRPVLPVLFDAVFSIGSEDLRFSEILRSKDRLSGEARDRLEDIKEEIDKHGKELRDRA